MRIGIHIVPNNNTLRSEIIRNRKIYSKKPDIVRNSLGLKVQILEDNKVHQSV